MAIAPRASTIERLSSETVVNTFAPACESNLHGGIAYSAYAGMNENGLSGVYLCAIDEALPRGDRYERHCSGLAHGQCLWCVRKQRCVRDDDRCKRSLQPRDTTDHAEDFFAGMKASTAVTNAGDSTCHVE